MADTTPKSTAPGVNDDFQADITRNELADLRATFPYRPTLFLGFGGTGCAAVSKMKDLFTRTFEGAARIEGNTEAIPSMYAFRAFDTQESARPANLTRNEEWSFLGIQDGRSFLKTGAAHPFYRDWLPPGLTFASLTDGAGGFRNLGRLALTYNMDIFRKAMSSALDGITGADPRTKTTIPIVYVFASLSGGTGAGMLLDACFYLRQNFPQNTQIVGLVGVLEGLTGMAAIPLQNCKVGCFAALKELHAFMMEEAAGLLGEKNAEPFTYPTGAAGRYGKPMTHCFLISQRNLEGMVTLPTPEHLTSFMSRYAFAMSAYSPRDPGKDPGFFGLLDNRKGEYDKTLSCGAKPLYAVPGIAQIHFPIEETVAWMCLKTAVDTLTYLLSGTRYEGDQDARQFADHYSLPLGQLVDHVCVDDQNQPVLPMRYDGTANLIRDGKSRRKNSPRILAQGDAMGPARLADIAGAMKAGVQVHLNEVKEALNAKVGEMIRDGKYLYRGVEDFMDDLQRIVSGDLEKLRQSDEANDERYAAVERDWSYLRGKVQDVTTSTGIVDGILDSFKAGQCATQYLAFMAEAENTLLERARSNTARAVLQGVKEQIDSLKSALAALCGQDRAVSRARGLLDARRERLAAQLYIQESGKQDSTTNIRSVSVLGEAERRRWLESHQEFRPESVVANLAKNGWTPLKWLDLMPGEGESVELLIAKDIYRSVVRLVRASGIDRLDITGVLGELQRESGKDPADQVIALICQQALPQMNISGMKNLPHSCDATAIIGGLSDSLAETLKARKGESVITQLSRAQTYDRGRIVYFASYMPAAIPGMTNIIETLEREYNSWRESLGRLGKGKGREREIGLFHCFKDSVNWPNPTELETALSKNEEIFAKAMALSEILEVDAADLAAMTGVASTPKEQRYALFRIGRSAYWLWPFFEPYRQKGAGATGRAAKPIEIPGKPAKLGTNIVTAWNAFQKDPDNIRRAGEWVSWYGENWGELFTGPEAKARLAKAIEALPGSDPDPECSKIWERTREALKAWDAQF